MANIKITPSTAKAEEIREEINEKIQHYESRMTYRLQRWTEAAELWGGNTYTQRENSKISPNSAELYKAVRAESNMIIRMLLGSKPAFELESNDIIGYDDPYKILLSEHYVQNQLDLSRFEKGMSRAINQVLLDGTVVVHEQYEPLRQSFLGQKQYVTSFRPLSLINCAFALDSYDVEESAWVGLSDVQSKSELTKLKNYDPKGEIYDLKEIYKAIEQNDYTPKVNQWVAQRMAYQGYLDGNFKGGMERRTFHGPLDCMHSGNEYCIEIVNREFIIHMEEYEGIRPVRIATINNMGIDPLGMGLYDLFRPLLTEIDESGSALKNMVALAGMSMFRTTPDIGAEDNEFVARQFGIVRTNGPLDPIGPNAQNLAAIAGYNQNSIQSFRQASGATDNLQAIVSGEQTTATQSALAMNEAIRNLSVMASNLAPVLVKDHIRVVIQNAQKYVTEPFVTVVDGTPITTVPADLRMDLNVRVKTITDQDFRPAKLARLREAVQLMTAVPPGSIPGKKLNPAPALLEILKQLDVPNYRESVQDITEEDLMNMALTQQLGQSQQAGPMPRGQEVPEETGSMKTPVGEVAAAPSDVKSAKQAVRSSNPMAR